MKWLDVAHDIIPVGEFKTGIYSWLKKVREEGHPLVITQNGRPTGVLVSPEEYDEFVCRKQFIESIEKGIADADSGKLYTTEEARNLMSEKRTA